jgi:hypothetical protein
MSIYDTMRPYLGWHDVLANSPFVTRQEIAEANNWQDISNLLRQHSAGVQQQSN